MNGEKESGVSTFFIDEKIDTGNIIFQQKVKIEEHENAGSLHNKLMHSGAQLISKTIDAINNNTAPNIEQKGESSQAPKIFKSDCRINWNNDPKKIVQKILGLSPYPASWTTLMGDEDKVFKIYNAYYKKSIHELDIGKAEISKTEFKVAVKNGFIYLDQVQISGKKRMKIDDFLRGLQNKENCFVK